MIVGWESVVEASDLDVVDVLLCLSLALACKVIRTRSRSTAFRQLRE
jgi:hypothetical protein